MQLAQNRQTEWPALRPGLALTIVVYSFNMFGDAVPILDLASSLFA